MEFQNTVIFDFDGTLVDSYPGICASAEAAYRTILPEQPVPSFEGRIGPPLREMFAALLPADISGEKVDELAKAFKDHYDTEGYKRSELYPRVREALNKLAENDVDCWLLTNKRRIPTERMLAFHRIDSFFARVVTSDSSVKNNKQAAFAECWGGNPLNSSKTVVVGDSKDDAAVASQYGFKFIGVSYGYGSAELSTILPTTEQMVGRIDEIFGNMVSWGIWPN